MKKIYGFNIVAIILGLAMTGCEDIRVSVPYHGECISVAAGVPATKGMMWDSDLVAGSQIKVYDVLSDGEHTRHIDDLASFVSADQPWSLANEPTVGSTQGYSWRPDNKLCDHNFFAWLSSDRNGITPASAFGSAISLHSNTPDDGVYTVSVPSTTMLLQSPQFDFSFSDVLTRDISTANYSTVNLDLKHFFTSFGIKAHNYDSDAITITSVKLYGIKNTKSATITFDTNTPGNSSTVAYSNQASSWTTAGNGLELLGGNINIESNAGVANIITCAAGGSKNVNATDAFYLMWPQTATEMASEYSDGALVVDYNNAILAVTYKAGSSSPVTKYVSLCPLGKTQGWDAGTCHQIELSFTSKFVDLSVSVRPWTFIERDVNYDKTISCNSEGELHFVDGTCVKDEVNHIIYFKNSATPIRGYFSFATPVNGSWMISKNGDFDAFEIDNELFGTWGDGVDYSYGTIDGTSVQYFTIYPKDQDPQRDYSLKLAFAVRTTSGDVYSADEVVQGVNPANYYTIILQSLN